MTDTIEQKALAQAVAAAGRRMQDYAIMAEENVLRQSIEAHARAIEQHEAFRQEVSDAVEQYWASLSGAFVAKPPPYMARFIIAKPDPLVEALDEALWEVSNVKLTDRELRAVSLRLNAKRGGEIVWGEG